MDVEQLHFNSIFLRGGASDHESLIYCSSIYNEIYEYRIFVKLSRVPIDLMCVDMFAFHFVSRACLIPQEPNLLRVERLVRTE